LLSLTSSLYNAHEYSIKHVEMMRSSAGDFYWGLAAHGSKPLWSADLIQLLQGKDRRKRPDRFYIGKKNYRYEGSSQFMCRSLKALSLLVAESFDLPSLFFISLPDINHVRSDKVSEQPTQDKMVASVPMANFQMAPTNNATPFSISMQHRNQQSQVPKKVKPPSISFRFKLFLASSSLHLTSLKV